MLNKKDFLRLFWPVLIEQLLGTAIGMVNTMMVSGIGMSAISAVSIVDSLNFVVMNFFTAFSTGATVVVAQSIGAKDNEKANETARQSLSACLLAAAMSGLAFMLFGLHIINWLFGDAEPSVKSSALVYLNYSAVSYPFLGLFSISAGILRASGNTSSPMRASLISNAVNAGVGAMFIYVFGMGVSGAGIALLLSRITAAGLLMVILFMRDEGVRINRVTFRFRRSILGPVVKIGLPACIDGLIFNGGKLLIQTLMTSLGTVSLAANGVASNVMGLINIPGNAIAIVSVTIVGQSVGAGILGMELKKRIRTLIAYAMGLLAVMTLVMVPFMPLILDLYAPPPDVKSLALSILHLALVFMPLTWPVAFILPSCIRSTGDSVFVTVASIISMWSVRVLGAWFAVHYTNWGLMGIWVFWCLDWVVRGIVFIARAMASPYINGKKMQEIAKNV